MKLFRIPIYGSCSNKLLSPDWWGGGERAAAPAVWWFIIIGLAYIWALFWVARCARPLLIGILFIGTMMMAFFYQTSDGM